MDDDGKGDYVTIQDAIDESQSGDTIRVFEGEYYENVIIDRSISLIGNGSTFTTIHGGGSMNVVTVTVDRVAISGFAMTNGYCGIFVEGNNSAIRSNNCSSIAYGIRLIYSNNSVIMNNTCFSNRYNGLVLSYSNNCTIENNTCSSNRYEGLVMYYSTNCAVRSNTCSSNGNYGFSFSASNNCIITDNTISKNRFGILLQKSHNCMLMNITCKTNENHGMYLYGSNNNTVMNSKCFSNNDDGIYLINSDHNEISDNLFSCNTNNAIHLSSSSFCSIMNNRIVGNRVGIYLRADSQNVTAHHNHIYSNSEFGINASDNNHSIDGTYNRWITVSGPYHKLENPEAVGDEVTENVSFVPWIDKHGNPIYGPDESSRILLHILFTLFIILIVTLFIVVRIPDQHFRKQNIDRSSK